jgi:steroid delta-isomerase-like uncharacterized protein
MSLQENKALVRRFVENVQNQHNLAEIDELYSPTFVDHSSGEEASGIEPVKAFFTMMFTAFPDMHFTIRHQLAEGDQVATHKTFTGTHLGTFMGIPPTGKQVSIEAMDILTIREGKITDHWSVGDYLSMLQQLGVVPAPDVSGTD